MATYISNQTGLWSSASTWLSAASGLGPLSAAGQPPQSFGGDKIIIRGGHIVTYDVQGCFGDETAAYGAGPGTSTTALGSISSNAIILSGGTLSASRTVNTELTARGNIEIGLSGRFDWGTSTDPLITNANIYLHYMQTSNMSASIGAAGMYLYGSDNNNQFFYNSIYINGKPKTRNTTLSVSAVSGSTILTLISAASALNWEVGDKLVVSTQNVSGVSTSVNSVPTTILSATNIQSITGNQITISPGLNTTRSAGTFVGNFSSNVNIRSAHTLYPSYGVFVNSSQAFICDISNCKFENVGNGVANTGNPYGPTGWNTYNNGVGKSTGAANGTPTAALTINFPNTVTIDPLVTPVINLKGLCFENVSTATTTGVNLAPPPTFFLLIQGKWTETQYVDNCNFLAINPTSIYGISLNSLANVDIKNTYIYRITYGISFGKSNCNLRF
jgi:hypothetical protein